MDPPLDPPPLPTPPTAAALPATANSTLPLPPVYNHPPYAEMITAAITELNEPDGSSKRAIAKYIETHNSNLPPNHDALLAHHLKWLKTNGNLLMVKHSYKLPGSTPVAVNGAVNAVPSDPASVTVKRRPGRPPKVRPEAVQDAVPVFAPPAVAPAPPNVGVVPETVFAAAGPVNGPVPVPVGPVRGRGRPPKRVGLKRGPGRPPKSGGGPSGVAVGRGRGRPKKNAVAAALTAARVGRPRGRPPKPINVAPAGGGIAAVGNLPAGGAGVGAPVAGKRRGRPPRAGGEAKKQRILPTPQPRKPRKLSGKPLGRPKKYASAPVTQTQTPDSQLLVAYLDLKAKLDNLQARIKQTATVIKPYLNNEAAVNALEELEMMATQNVNAPTSGQSQQQPEPDQVES